MSTAAPDDALTCQDVTVAVPGRVLVAGLDAASTGRILVGGRDITGLGEDDLARLVQSVRGRGGSCMTSVSAGSLASAIAGWAVIESTTDSE